METAKKKKCSMNTGADFYLKASENEIKNNDPEILPQTQSLNGGNL